MSVPLSAWKNSDPTGLIFIKFEVYLYFSKKRPKKSSSIKIAQE